MHLVPKQFQHKAIIHRTHPFATGASLTTLLVTAPATGLQIVPVAFAWCASAAGSFTITKGSGGGSYFIGGFIVGNDLRYIDWWDDGAQGAVGNATSLDIIKAEGVGLGQFHVWYMIRRVGAGSGGTDQ